MTVKWSRQSSVPLYPNHASDWYTQGAPRSQILYGFRSTINRPVFNATSTCPMGRSILLQLWLISLSRNSQAAWIYKKIVDIYKIMHDSLIKRWYTSLDLRPLRISQHSTKLWFLQGNWLNTNAKSRTLIYHAYTTYRHGICSLLSLLYVLESVLESFQVRVRFGKLWWFRSFLRALQTRYKFSNGWRSSHGEI